MIPCFDLRIHPVFIFLSCVLFAEYGICEQWAFRARENYEILKTDDRATYKGFSSSINVFYEKPFEYAYGIVFLPGLGTLKSDSSSNTVLGNELRFYSIGLETKQFPLKDYHFFFRGGVFYHLARTKTSTDALGGSGAAIGLGWEFWSWNIVSISPEIGYKYTHLRTGDDLQGAVISIGLHFYKLNTERIFRR